MDYSKYAQQWLDLPEDQKIGPFIREGINLFTDASFGNAIKNLIADKRVYYYMLTFNLKPECWNKKSIDKARKTVIRTATREPLQISRCHYVEEHTKVGTEHWHMSIITSKRLKKDRFADYNKNYGFVHISENKAQTYWTMLDYMNKENMPIHLLGDRAPFDL